MTEETLDEIIARLRPLASDGTYAAHVLDRAAADSAKYGLVSQGDLEAINEMQRRVVPAPCAHRAAATGRCAVGVAAVCPSGEEMRRCAAYLAEEPVDAEDLRREVETWE